jgi:hypothetical protein
LLTITGLLVAYLTARSSQRSKDREQREKLLELLGQVEQHLGQEGLGRMDIDDAAYIANEADRRGVLGYMIGLESVRLAYVTELVSERKRLKAENASKQAELERIEAETVAREAELERLEAEVERREAANVTRQAIIQRLEAEKEELLTAQKMLQAQWDKHQSEQGG